MKITKNVEQKNAIVLTGGGTAGHVMPNIALLPHLKKHFNEIHYIGTNGMEKDILSKHPEVIYHEICATKLDRSARLKNLAIPFKLIKSVNMAKKVLKEINPSVVFSKGGFVALPVALAAKCTVITHESDLSLGLANKIAAKKSTVLLSIFPINHKKAKAVGAPLRQELFEGNKTAAIKQLAFTTQKSVLLVMGGSLGAQAINTAIRECLPTLTKQFNIVHLTGKGAKKEELESGSYRQLEFANNIADIYAATDIAVSRAGAGSVTELAALKIPTLLIPLPKGASRGDQIENAQYMQKQGLMQVTYQPLTSEKLINAIKSTHQNRHSLTQALSAHSFNGTQKILTEILTHTKNPK